METVPRHLAPVATQAVLPRQPHVQKSTESSSAQPQVVKSRFYYILLICTYTITGYPIFDSSIIDIDVTVVSLYLYERYDYSSEI